MRKQRKQYKSYKKHDVDGHAGLSNKQMNNETYKERRIVMNHLYTLKNHVRKHGLDIPRINVRIAETARDNSPLGLGRHVDRTIWIPIQYFQNTSLEKHLLFVVAHEILHAAYNVPHKSDCGLMCPMLNKKLSDSEVLSIFTSYVKKYSQ